MRVAMMTREYPPEVYGGAGVHVTELVAQLRHLCEVDVHCMGAPREGATVAQPDPAEDTTKAIIEFNRLIYSSPELFTTILPIRDGVAVARKK